MKRELAFVCSPLRGDVEGNIKRAKEYCRWLSYKKNVIPFAPHLYFTTWLEDNIESERNFGITAGLDIMNHCNEMYVFCEGDSFKNLTGITEGMAREIWYALNELKMQIHYINRDSLTEIEK